MFHWRALGLFGAVTFTEITTKRLLSRTYLLESKYKTTEAIWPTFINTKLHLLTSVQAIKLIFQQILLPLWENLIVMIHFLHLIPYYLIFSVIDKLGSPQHARSPINIHSKQSNGRLYIFFIRLARHGFWGFYIAEK